MDKKSVVVEIISDSKKFVQGFEDAITLIEKTAKKADILDSQQSSIDNIKKELKEISSIIANLSPSSSTGEFEKFEKKMNSIDEKIKDIKKSIKNVGNRIDISGIENLQETIQKLVNDSKKAENILSNLGISKKKINDINSVEDIKEAYSEAIKKISEFSEELQKDTTGNVKKKYQSTIEELYKILLLTEKIDEQLFDIKKPTIFSDSDEEVDRFYDSLQLLEKNVLKSTKTIKSEVNSIDINKIIGNNIKESFANYTIKNGKITVPLVVETTSEKLKNQANEIIQKANGKISPLTVQLETVAKDNVFGINQELKDEDLKSTDFAKKYKKMITSALTEAEDDIKKGMRALKQAVNSEKIYIYPEVKIKEDDKQKLQDELKKLSSTLKFTESTTNLKNAIKEMVDSKAIEKWGKAFNSTIDSISIRIETLFERLKNNSLETLNFRSKDFNEDTEAIKSYSYILKILNENLKNFNSKDTSSFDIIAKNMESLISVFDRLSTILSSQEFEEMVKPFNEMQKPLNNIKEIILSIQNALKTFSSSGTSKKINSILEAVPQKAIKDANVADYILSEEDKKHITELANNITIEINKIFETNKLDNWTEKFLKSLEIISNKIQSLFSKNILDLNNNLLQSESIQNKKKDKLILVDPLEEKYEKLKQSFKSFSNKDGSIDLRTKAIKEFVEEYNKYVLIGGTKGFDSFTNNKKTIEKLNSIKNKNNINQDSSFDDINEKIAKKNKLFEEEKHIVYESVKQEKEDLQRLIEKLESLNNILSTINSQKIDINLNSSGIKSFSGLLDRKDISEKFKNITADLELFSNNINKLQINPEFLNSLNNILSKSEELNALSSVLKNSNKNIKEVSKSVLASNNLEKAQESLTKNYSKIIENFDKEMTSNNFEVLNSSLEATKDGVIKITSLIKDMTGAYKQFVYSTKDGTSFALTGEHNNPASIEKQIKDYEKLKEQQEHAVDNYTNIGEINNPRAWSTLVDLMKDFGIESTNVLKIIRNIDEAGQESFQIFDKLGRRITLGVSSDKILYQKDEVVDVENTLKNYYKTLEKLSGAINKDLKEKTKESKQVVDNLKNEINDFQYQINNFSQMGLLSQKQFSKYNKTTLAYQSTFNSKINEDGLSLLYDEAIKKLKDYNQLKEKLYSSSLTETEKTELSKLEDIYTEINNRIQEINKNGVLSENIIKKQNELLEAQQSYYHSSLDNFIKNSNNSLSDSSLTSISKYGFSNDFIQKINQYQEEKDAIEKGGKLRNSRIKSPLENANSVNIPKNPSQKSINSVSKKNLVEVLKREKEELMESLEMFYKVFYLGMDEE